jgi:pimeloyl-ACP methyl ester carboxylesterase
VLQSSYIDVQGARIHVVAGGEGRPILFLHGFPEFWFAWKAQLAELAKTHRVMAIDLPGCNLSAPLPSAADYALAPVAARIAALARLLVPDGRLSLVGHDIGGTIAWEVAARHADLVRAFVAINGPPAAVFARQLARDPEQRRASEYVLRFRDPAPATPPAEVALAAGGFQRLRRFVFDAARDPDAFPPRDREGYLKSWARPGALTGALAYYRAAELDRVASPPLVEAPTLVLWGEADRSLHLGCLDGIEAMGRDVRVRRVPGATHWIAREEPALVSACVREMDALAG